MSFGKMNTFIEIIDATQTKDKEGFTFRGETVVAKVRAYKEERHGSRKWANMAAYSKANAIFQFRRIPGIPVEVGQLISCNTGRYKIISVENISGLYVEVAAEKTEPTKD